MNFQNKTKSSAVDTMFSSIIKNKPCFYIWRIEVRLINLKLCRLAIKKIVFFNFVSF